MLVFKSSLFLLLLLHIEYIQSVQSSCPDLYSTGNDSDFCYFYKKTPLPWSDAYHQCLTRTLDGILMGIFSTAQFDALARLNLDGATSFWLGANNFASFYDSQWHWLNGLPVDNNVINWCANSSQEIAIGTQCLAYDSASHCVTNYPCNTLLPAPCVSLATSGAMSPKSSGLRIGPASNRICWNIDSGDNYAHWWTYAVLLLNWFTLFCFFLYLCNRFLLDKNTLIITGIFAFLSFIMMLTLAILWGVQYQDIKQIPLATVILGCLAGVLLILVILIVLSDRTRVQRWSSCMIIIVFVLILESFLMLGVILCVAFCSSYITLAWTGLEKDIIASLLASLITGISIFLCTVLLCMFENTTPERVQPVKPATASVAPMITTQTPVPHHPPNNAHASTHRTNSTVAVKKPEQIARATSPVDERILQEFYADQPKNMHSYTLEGRQYVVYEGKSLTDVETHRKELVQAMLLQEPQGLREAIDNAKNSFHSTVLSEEIEQAQSLISKISTHGP